LKCGRSDSILLPGEPQTDAREGAVKTTRSLAPARPSAIEIVKSSGFHRRVASRGIHTQRICCIAM
jgi:hypothetical protein